MISFQRYYNLDENTLYSNPAEKDALVADKERVASAFMFNFWAMLGLINATTPTQRNLVLKHFKTDKKLRLTSIGDDNHDISLSLKLAVDAGFFLNQTTPNEITRFLVKLKSGQIDAIDNKVVYEWAKKIKPNFSVLLTNPRMKAAWKTFIDGKGVVDISHIAVQLKTLANRFPESGDFKVFAKKFGKLSVKNLAAANLASVTPAPTPATIATAQAVKSPAISTSAAPQTPAPVPAPSTPVAPMVAVVATPKPITIKATSAAKIATVTPTKPVVTPQNDMTNIIKKALSKEDEIVLIGFIHRILKSIIRSDYTGDEVFEEWFKEFNLNIDLASLDVIRAGIENALTEDEFHSFARDMKAFLSEFDNKYPGAMAKAIDTFNFEAMLSTSGKMLFELLILAMALVAYDKQYVSFFDRVMGYFKSSYQLPTDAKSIHTIMIAKSIGIGEQYVERMSNIIQNYSPLSSKQLATVYRLFDNYSPASISATDAELVGAHYINLYKQQKTATVAGIVESFDRNATIRKFFDQSLLICQNILYKWNEFAPLYRIQKDAVERVMASYDIASKVTFYIGLVRGVIDMEELGVNVKETAHELIAMAKKDIDALPPTDIVNDLDRRTYVVSGADLLIDATDYFKKLWRINYPLYGSDHDMTPEMIYYFRKFNDIFGVKYTNPIFSGYADITENGVNESTLKSIDSIVTHIAKQAENKVTATSIIKLRIVDNMITAMKESGDVEEITSTLMTYALSIFDDVKKDSDEAKAIFRNLRPRQMYYGSRTDSLLKKLQNCNSDTVIKWVRKMAEYNDYSSIGADNYKNSKRAQKQYWVAGISSIIMDCLHDPVASDYLNSILDDVPANVVNGIRANLVGMDILKSEIENGAIKPFISIDTNRIRTMLVYNDLDLSTVLAPIKIRKNKGESFVDYIKRARDDINKNMKNVDSILGDLKVEEVTNDIDINAINYKMITDEYAGRHGNLAPKILKAFNVHLSHEEFDEFRKNNFGDGSVIPAYHGTGGTAASMILRYGFKVIKASDSSVVGRMLGNGIYFSNKVDKVGQYVSESGYARRAGYKGYIFQLDTNLGKRGSDYRAAGLGGDRIRSPEWCVFNPRAQARILRVYEVIMLPRQQVFSALKRMTVESFSVMVEPVNITSYVFRDGIIPVLNKAGELEYMDFEEALETKRINRKNFDVSQQGPVIVFKNTDETVMYDYRFVNMIENDATARKTYIRYMTRDMGLDFSPES